MKLRHIIPASIALAAMALTACSDMLDLKSDDYVFAGDNPLNSANDSLYSAMGIHPDAETRRTLRAPR